MIAHHRICVQNLAGVNRDNGCYSAEDVRLWTTETLLNLILAECDTTMSVLVVY